MNSRMILILLIAECHLTEERDRKKCGFLIWSLTVRSGWHDKTRNCL